MSRYYWSILQSGRCEEESLKVAKTWFSWILISFNKLHIINMLESYFCTITGPNDFHLQLVFLIPWITLFLMQLNYLMYTIFILFHTCKQKLISPFNFTIACFLFCYKNTKILQREIFGFLQCINVTLNEISIKNLFLTKLDTFLHYL